LTKSLRKNLESPGYGAFFKKFAAFTTISFEWPYFRQKNVNGSPAVTQGRSAHPEVPIITTTQDGLGRLNSPALSLTAGIYLKKVHTVPDK
jgi:hypothetical protein